MLRWRYFASRRLRNFAKVASLFISDVRAVSPRCEHCFIAAPPATGESAQLFWVITDIGSEQSLDGANSRGGNLKKRPDKMACE
jgi:hypothetical protein